MSLATSDIDFLRGLIARQSGNVISARQVYMLEQRLVPVAQEIGLTSVRELVEALRKDSRQQLSAKVAEAVTVNETSFFRDMHLFQALKTKIIPEIVERNQLRRTIDIWCAACSSGQEPYSTAMVFREHFPFLNSWNIRILATDISEEMLERTKQGVYSQLEVNRGLPMKTLLRFFDRHGAHWKAKNELRSMVTCRRLNLTQGWPRIGVFDIVMARNVLIYFDQASKTRILHKMKRAIASDGYLFIGSAEMLLGLSVPFERQEIDGTVCYRPTNS